VTVHFIADVHLGKLARQLRLLGMDTWYSNTCTNEDLLYHASLYGRTLLSRNVAFKKQPSANVLIIEHKYPGEQLRQVLNEYNITGNVKPFTRCMSCNGELHTVAKELVFWQLPENTRLYYDEFWQCHHCRKIYWKGPHYQRMLVSLRQFGFLKDD
jgi:hypothetical protein